jgi:hypothetical protein
LEALFVWDGLILLGATMAKPLDPKEIVTAQEIAISNMLEFKMK